MTSSVSYTSRILNYVEPYYVDGVAKSAFYTEVNTNLKRNDKAFILNGYHDSEEFISKGRYAKNADGYKVLFSDRCKIVLDIDYNGITHSYVEDSFDNYIKIYHITSQREFDYINKIFVDSYTQKVSKFEKELTNNIIYTDTTFFGTSNGIGKNNGISTSGAFWSRNGITWENVTNNFNYNTFVFSNAYYAAGMTNNGRIYIVGEDLSYSNKTYKQRNIYKFGTASINDWNIDIQHKQPIITKLNFREGTFRGIHNDGIFGSYLKEEVWDGTKSSWNSGFLVNTNWKSGIMNSKSTNSDPSYYSIIKSGKPIQTTDFSNNKGFGYNYILDSNILGSYISNGNFINCNVGVLSTGLTAVDDYFGYNNVYAVSSNGGLYNYCNVNNSKLSESTTLDSIVNNSHLLNTKTLNSQLLNTYSKGGEFSTNNAISILSSDIESYVPNTTTSVSDIRGVLKLYISNKDYGRLDTFDNFYITKINKDYIISSLDSDQKISLPYETRYVLDSFWDFKISGSSLECFTTLKTLSDNRFKTHVEFVSPNYNNVSSTNENRYASIDIDLGEYLAFYINGTSWNYINQNTINKDNVQKLFLKTHISNSDFRSGVMEKITWVSGSNVNFPSNIIKVENNKLKISKFSSDEIHIYLNEPKPTIADGQLRIGKSVWIDSIQHTDALGGVVNISGDYKITNIEYHPSAGVFSNEARITLLNPLISSVPVGGTFSVSNLLPTYASIQETMIDSSTINSGLFIRNLFKRSNTINETFNVNDKNMSLSNIDKLRIVNHIFKDNDNTISSGVVHKSHILNVNWISGISSNSIWVGPTFGGGVFNSGHWLDGTFKTGHFQNSRGIILSAVDYDMYTYYKNWFKGTFDDGIFSNSVWLDGIHNNGKLYNSDWYGGIWNNGILGDKNTPVLNTNMSRFYNIGVGATQTFWYDGIVENAQIGGDGVVYWYDGKFNNGRFVSSGTSELNESVWYNGEFNGGDFSDLSRWKGGSFNKGKFRSHYGWTMSSSTYSFEYGWESGKFNGGQFGVGEYATNSTWYDGEFNGGIFQGRVWNNGVFQNGNFNGGSTISVVSSEEIFTESFTQSYYGLWRNGWVTNIKHKAITNELISTNNLRSSKIDPQKYATLQNVLWLDGKFDHPQGLIRNSAWLSGKFTKGTFNNGVFNPYVRRDHWDSSYGTYSSFNFSLFDCMWENGTFDFGDFNISDWYDGTFVNGTMSGGRWINGVWEYGYAKNTFWENGVWKNGVWNGSPFDYKDLDNNNEMTLGRNRDSILRVSNILRNGKLHLINAFTGSSLNELLLDTNPTDFSGWTFSDTGSPTDWTQTPIGLQVGSSALSTPSISSLNVMYNTPSSNLWTWVFSVGSSIYAGDKFIVSVYFPSVMKSGSIIVVASPGDTMVNIAQSLVSRINNAHTQPYVEYVVYQPGGNITQYVTWGFFEAGIYPYAVYSTAGIFDFVGRQFNYPYASADPVNIPGTYNESEILYALVAGPTTSAFTQSSDVSSTIYAISLDVINSNGRTDFDVYIGSDPVYRETITGNVNKRYTYSFTTPSGEDYDKRFGIKRVLYRRPNNSIFTISSASVRQTNVNYSSYNNKIFEFSPFTTPFVYGPLGSVIPLPPNIIPRVTSENKITSLNFGNGTFKSGIWENGVWNNGWRSTWDPAETDTLLFTDVVIGGTLRISDNTWIIKIQSFDGTSGLNVGDKVSIGNIVCIDVNENRRLIHNYYRIIAKDDDTITVEISLNMSVRRIIKDSEDHMIYVSKNVWLSGVFHNGYFKGIWNYGLFKGYPYITNMEDTQWIDGVFDGGRFASTQSYYLSNGIMSRYNTGLIQNFAFRDNNVAESGSYLYNSWMDVNYFTYSMSNIFKDNMRYDYDYDVTISDGNLRGYPTNDVLSSESIFRNSYDTNYKYYKLGSKYRIYVDYIGNSSYFNYPIKTGGIPGPGEFISNGWTYSNNSTQYYSNTGNSDDNELVIEYTTQSYSNVGIKAVQTSKVLYENPWNTPSNGAQTILGSRVRDFSDIPLTNYTFTSTSIGGSPINITNRRFSNLSYTASQWSFHDNPNLSPNINTYPVTLRSYPSGQISGYNNNSLLGDTHVNIRRVYMMDWFNFSSIDPQYGGYNNPGIVPNEYKIYGQTGGFGTFSFYAYTAQSNTTLTLNAFVPFRVYGNERSYNSTSRPGWTTIKLVGVVERCGTGSNPYKESNWQYVTSTKMDYYGNSGETTYGNSIAMDKDKCCVVWDDNLPAGALFGKLYLNNTNINVSTGDLIRFRVYWIDIRKMFASSNNGAGQVSLLLGVDPSMGYTENNHGFFEILDTKTYFNTNTNILDNIYTRDIEKFRYSVVDFDLNTYHGIPFQGGMSSSLSALPTIYLLNNNYPNNLSGNSSLINHVITPGINKKEYFYNRKSLQIFFKSTDMFDAHFGKMSFYETDMIPFFRYTTEENVDGRIKAPLFSEAPFINGFNSSISLNNNLVLLGITQSF